MHVLEMSDRGWWLCRCVVWGLRGAGVFSQGQGLMLTKACSLLRFGCRTGLLPSVLLQPDGLGMLLSGPGGEGDRVGKAQSSPEPSQATTFPPTMPARPPLSAIQSRCCTITRRALRKDSRVRDPLEGM